MENKARGHVFCVHLICRLTSEPAIFIRHQAGIRSIENKKSMVGPYSLEGADISFLPNRCPCEKP